MNIKSLVSFSMKITYAVRLIQLRQVNYCFTTDRKFYFVLVSSPLAKCLLCTFLPNQLLGNISLISIGWLFWGAFFYKATHGVFVCTYIFLFEITTDDSRHSISIMCNAMNLCVLYVDRARNPLTALSNVIVQ